MRVVSTIGASGPTTGSDGEDDVSRLALALDVARGLDDLVVSGPPIDASAPSGFELFNAGSTGITAQIITGIDGLGFGAP